MPKTVRQPPPQTLANYATTAREPDLWWFCLFYAVTFGGFVGLASFLNIFTFTINMGSPSRRPAALPRCVLWPALSCVPWADTSPTAPWTSMTLTTITEYDATVPIAWLRRSAKKQIWRAVHVNR